MKRLTTTQTAKELGTSRARVVALIKDGRIKAERFGRDWSIWNTDLTPELYGRKPGRPRKAGNIQTTAPKADSKQPKAKQVPVAPKQASTTARAWEHPIATLPKRKIE